MTAVDCENMNWSDCSCKEVPGAGKTWNDRRFLYWIYPVSDAAARAQSYSQGTNHHNESEFFDIRIGCLDISIKVGVAKKYARRVA